MLAAAVALRARPPPAARALVDGIPLYAPGDRIKLPENGFESYLDYLRTPSSCRSSANFLAFYDLFEQ